MKVIDLLNKIANGEEIPEMFKYNDEIVILNEYDEEVSVKEFLQLVEEKQKTNNINNFSDCKNIDGYRFSDSDFS